MIHRLALALVGAAASLGCTAVLDLDGYSVKPATVPAPVPPRDPALQLGPSIARFDSYRFERGSETSYTVTAEAGVLFNDAPDARARAQISTTARGGRFQLEPDGAFRYTPPGVGGAAWGDDYVEYELESAPPASARVRLTLAPAALSLAELAASSGSGFGVAGASVQDSLGRDPQSFAPAGDVNGDGFEDVVVGVRGPAGSDGRNGVGRAAYVLFGKADGLNVSLSEVAAGRGFAIVNDNPEQALDNFGFGVAGAGDVNGDGFDDVVIGSYTFASSDAPDTSGIAYVVFGKRDSAAVSTADLRAGTGGGFAIRAFGLGYQAVGFDVDGAGDVNGDGLDDVIVGVPVFDSESSGDAGGAHVVFGKVGAEPVRLEGITSGDATGFPILGDRAREVLGVFVAGVGDVNGDGLSDVALGSDGSIDGLQQGRSVVVFGATSASAVQVADIQVGSSRGFVIDGAESLDGAARVARAGDVNGDGFDDILVAAPVASLEPSPAPAAREAPVVEPETLAIPGADAGIALPAEPVRGDEPQRGLVYVVLGRRDPSPVALLALERGEGAGFAIAGTRDGQLLGYSLSSGDIDGDGLSDVVVASPPSAQTATAHVVFGKRDTRPVPVPAGAAPAGGVLAITGTSTEQPCGVVASGFDANADGLDDLLISALLYPAAPQAAGGAYLAFGWDISGALAARDRALVGGSEDDPFELTESPLVIARGGNGRDTLHVGSEIREVDLTLPGRYQSIEIVDVRGGGPHVVRLDDAALRRMPQNHLGLTFDLARTLTVLGDSQDRLEFSLEGFEMRGGGAGRIVYARPGSYYGLEASRELSVVSP